MKKIANIILVAVVILVITISGCGSSGSGNNSGDNNGNNNGNNDDNGSGTTYMYYLYTNSTEENYINGFSINTGTGALTPLTETSTADKVNFIIAHPNGKLLYALLSNNTIQAYTIDASTGALTPSGAALPTGAFPSGAAFARDNKYLFVTNSNGGSISRYGVDTSGGLSSLGASESVGLDPVSIVANTDGTSLYVCCHGMLSIITLQVDSSGVLTSKSTSTEHWVFSAAVYGQYLYVVYNHERDLYANITRYGLDSDGWINNSPVDFEWGYLDPDPNPYGMANKIYVQGDTVYLADYYNKIATYTIDPSTGKLTYVSAYILPSEKSPMDFAGNPNLPFIYVVIQENLISGDSYDGKIFGYQIGSGGTLTDLSWNLSGGVKTRSQPSSGTIVRAAR